MGGLMDLRFYKGKRVLLTGHTGFKGASMSRALIGAGAIVTGYSLNPPTEPNLFSLSDVAGNMTSIIGDVRDFAHLKRAFDAAQPEIVLHLAARPIVRTSYEKPVYTYETNVMGTVNLLECVRTAQAPVRSVVNVTTDKVYENKEWAWGYRENEPLDGYDPYSNSKSCSELVTHSYKNSFFADGKTAISTARAGNVIGGGDFARDRIIPDCIRAAQKGEPVVVRNPHSTRPYQHVLEPVMAYLMIAQRQMRTARSQDGIMLGRTIAIASRQAIWSTCSAKYGVRAFAGRTAGTVARMRPTSSSWIALRSKRRSAGSRAGTFGKRSKKRSNGRMCGCRAAISQWIGRLRCFCRMQ